jgi:fructose-bisphosphate aldolase class 1
MPDLNVLLIDTKEAGIFGTRLSSWADRRTLTDSLRWKQIIGAGLIPIIKTEVDINSQKEEG